MIQLQRTSDPTVSYPLLVDKKYVVGRKQGDITFSDDPSISRTHAELVVEHSAGNINEPLLTPVLTLTDMGSKYGTYATEENIASKTPVNAREPITLAIGDKLRFGLQLNEFRVNYTPLVVTSSQCKVSQELKSKIIKLGGHFVNEWSPSVTHVIVEKLTLTVKVVCALMSAKPIVTPAYINALLDGFESRTGKPDLKRFLPAIGEPSIEHVGVSKFLPDESRTTLFAGKTFLFCNTKHVKKIGAAIEAAGGSVKLISDACNENVLNNNFVIMGSPLEIAESEKDIRIKQTLDAYKSGGKRLITDSEIGLAAVHSSVEKHCNPRISIAKTVMPPIRSQTQHSSSSSSSGVNRSVIVPETQPSNGLAGSDNGRDSSSVRVVDETVMESESDSRLNTNSNGSRTGRGTKRGPADAGASLAKKRPAEDSLAKSEVKRSKDVGSASYTRMPSSSTSNSAVKNTKTSAEKTLNNLFGFTDSEEEEDEQVTTVPESQPQFENESIDVVPESQPPIVSVVDVKKLQSFTVGSASILEEEDVSLVPASPEVLEEEEIAVPNHGTDFVSTVRSSVMEAKTLVVEKLRQAPVEESTPRRHSKRALVDNKISKGIDVAVQGSSRKRLRGSDSSPNENDDNVKRITLEDMNKKLMETTPTPVLPVMKRALVNKNLSHELSLLSVGDSQASVVGAYKNFKRFRKVLPTFIEKSMCQENRMANRRKPNSLDISALDNVKPVKLKAVHYEPGDIKYKPGDLPFALVPKEDSPPPVDAEFGFEEDEPPERMTRGRKKKDQPVPKRKETRSNFQLNDEEEPSTSAGPTRRVSPRKAVAPGPSLRLRSCKAPTPPPVVDVDDEEDDDMWSFSR